MSKRKATTIIFVSCAMAAMAQETVTQMQRDEQEADISYLPATADVPYIDTLALPKVNERGIISRHSAYTSPAGWNDWELHPGLNASLSLSATVGLGSKSGSGFAQSIALMYATELVPRLSLAVGGYYSHFNWGATQFNDAGFSAVLGYRFNEHWEAYIFGQKSVVTPKKPVPIYSFGDFGDKIGAEVRYNFSPSFSIGVSVWHQSTPNSGQRAPMPRH